MSPVQQNLVICEELIDLLQRQILRSGIEEVDQRHKQEVENGKVEVRFPMDAADADRCDFDYKECEDPITGSPEGLNN